MNFYPVGASPILYELRSGKPRFSPFMQLFAFIVVFGIADLLNSVFSSFALTFFTITSDPAAILRPSADMLTSVTEKAAEIQTTPAYIAVSLFLSAIYGVTAVVYCRFFERRRLGTMGFRKENAGLSIPIGIAAGAGLFAVSVLLCTWNGAVSVTVNEDVPVGTIILFFFAFLVQATGEELLVRGYYMTSLAHYFKPTTAVVLSSLMFAVLHTGNDGFGFLAFLNITLVGVFLAVLTLRTGSILPSCFFHALWNFAEGCVFGTAVSGTPALPSICTAVADPAKSLTNGGTFGPEGGIAVTLTLVVALFVLLLIPSNRHPEKPLPTFIAVVVPPDADSDDQNDDNNQNM